MGNCVHKYKDFSSLPKRGNNIDWKKSAEMNLNFYFEYDDVKGYINIIDFKSEKRKSKIKIEFKGDCMWVTSRDIKCLRFGKLLGKRTSDFKIEIGTTFKDDKRDITITDRRYKPRKNNNGKKKWYKYKCNKCGHEGWIVESALIRRNNCSCCINKIVIRGVNDIATTDPWMVKYFVNPEDAYKYTSHSGKKVDMKCPDCGNVKKNYLISNLNAYKTLPCNCSDTQTYPNKFMFNLLKQLNIEFKSEYSPEWISPKRFDFYIPSKNLIIEMDGGLGHGYNDNTLNGMKKEDSKKIDLFKDEMANKNKLSVIRIDCNYKTDRFRYIKNSILTSNLINHFELASVNWDKANEYAMGNLIKEVCSYYEKYKNKTTMKEIGGHFYISKTTLISYLKQGSSLGWCKYNCKNGIRIKIKETNDIFKSISECSRMSKELYGVNFDRTCISNAIKNKKTYKGYTFEQI